MSRACEHSADALAKIFAGLSEAEKAHLSRAALALGNVIPEGASVTFTFERERLVSGPGGAPKADVLGFLVVTRPTLAVPMRSCLAAKPPPAGESGR